MAGILKISTSNDFELATLAMEGHRDAFAGIVSRYQSLVCSLAYSATGSLSQSEDLAQETFIAAWKGIGTLREPEKLRSWLCGIARNIIASTMRSRKQEPANVAEPLNAAADLPASDSLPVDRAIGSEEESILWRSLEHIPQIYREPLILFYREGQSIESVAQALELSEDAVRQRLSRGRKMLKLEVEAFVEAALRQSAPGREFTSAVLAGLPALSSASISTVALASSKGTAIAKGGFSIAGLIGALFVPIVGFINGAILFPLARIKDSRSAREKALWKRVALTLLALVVFESTAPLWVHQDRVMPVIICSTVGAMFLVCVIAGVARKRILREEGLLRESTDPRLIFGRRESPGFKWNLYANTILLTFCNPFAFLTTQVAVAHDYGALFAMFAVLFAIFLVSRRILIRRPERWMNVWPVVSIIEFVLLLIVVQLRWKTWTGQSPWQLQSQAWIPVGVGFLMFVFTIVYLLMKRNR